MPCPTKLLEYVKDVGNGSNSSSVVAGNSNVRYLFKLLSPCGILNAKSAYGSESLCSMVGNRMHFQR
eukprot:9754212-Karenia_brevis.AAC.1